MPRIGWGIAGLLIMTCAVVASPDRITSKFDWAQWRGPNRDGISKETGLLTEWPDGGPKLVWRTEGLGLGYTTLSVVGNRIYCTGDYEDADHAYALNAENGEKLWSKKIGKAGAPGWGNFEGPRAEITVDDKLLFAMGQWGELVCLQAADGKEVWQRHLVDDLGGPLPEWGYCESPLVDGNQVVVTPGGDQGTLAALDKQTGKTVWRSQEFTDHAHYSSLIKVTIDNVPQYIVLTDTSVAGIAPQDGKLLWRADRKGKTAVIPTPIYHDHLVYVTSGYDVGCNCFKISSADGKFSAEEVYQNKVMANHHGGVILVGDKLYGHSDKKGWTCQDLASGERVWADKKSLGKGSIFFAEGRFYLREEEGPGTVALIEATPDGYREHGRFDQPDRTDKHSWSHPIVAGGRLYLRDQDLLLVYDVRK